MPIPNGQEWHHPVVSMWALVLVEALNILSCAALVLLNLPVGLLSAGLLIRTAEVPVLRLQPHSAQRL